MKSIKEQARFAGLLYLLASIPAPFGLIYVPNTLIVTGDATATADHVRASETLLRLGIASELIGSIVFIFVVLALYRLFKGVNEKQALAMAILILFSIPFLLFMAGFGYVARSFTSLLLPPFAHFVDRFAGFLELGELPIIFWLLIWGAKDQRLDEQHPDPAIA